MVSLKNGVSDRGGLPMARGVLEISWSEVPLDGSSDRGSAGSTLIITVLGLATLVMGPSGLTNPGTQTVLFIVGVETAIVAFPTWEMGKRKL